MDLATRTIIDYFEQINQHPRCSKHEQQISLWLQQWALDRELPVETDAAGNLVLRVPASSGFEQAPIVILQGHMDMVCEKSDRSDHDFSNDPIRMVQDGPWLNARGTTLGADNGIALAMLLTLVDDPEVSHPPLELFFTVDEETGLTGVLQMDPSLLSGKRLINLDSEDEGVLVVGCAGGRNTTIRRSLDFMVLEDSVELLGVSVHGMLGGHSGVDIAKHRANAIKVMVRLLNAAMAVIPIRLVELMGGTGNNVIPRACEALVACHRNQINTLADSFRSAAEIIKMEYRMADPGLDIHLDRKGAADASRRGVTQNDTVVVVNLLAALPSGPVEMAEAFPLLVQTSTNLSIAKVKDDALTVVANQRSSVPSQLDAICQVVEAAGSLAGAAVHTGRGYPSWPMNPESELLKRCTGLYRELFNTMPTVQIMHAGLECGVIGDRCPGMDMISMGPTIENPHSPSERLNLPSVEKVWQLMVALLASFKNK